MAQMPVDTTAFSAFGMQELDAAGFRRRPGVRGRRTGRDVLLGLDCFNCEIAKKAMLAKSDEIRALHLRKGHCEAAVTAARAKISAVAE